ncbi:MAG: hypothetical protein J6S85_25110 [Methanobrevibacter sp.]|nr:hypothetical protein [Methanobrevibacter sp.]
MLSRIEWIKKEMELQLDDDIFNLDVWTMYQHYGIYGARMYSGLRLACFLNNYKINKYVFDEYSAHEIVDVMRMMHNVWLKESKRSKDAHFKRYAEVLSDICFEYYDVIPARYIYYRDLNAVYDYILTNIDNCKTLPNKYTTKERRIQK